MFACIDATFLSDDKSKVNRLEIVLVYSVKLEFKMILLSNKTKQNKKILCYKSMIDYIHTHLDFLNHLSFPVYKFATVLER